MMKYHTRREFVKEALAVLGMIAFGNKKVNAATRKRKKDTSSAISTVYRAINGSADQNLIKIIEMIGGVEKIIAKDDVVVIKPNVQWWNQGAPNLLALSTFVELIMHRPSGFEGEVVIAENCHRGNEPWKSAGWSRHFERNSSINGIHNFNELAHRLKHQYGDRYSTVHWINVKYGANRVYSAQDGIGYVFCDGTGGVPEISFANDAKGADYRETIMTYPIFKTDRGTLIDYKNGIWKNGQYDNQRVKFINLAALNHHSTYCGITSLIKNYLGVSDLSGGPDPHNDGMLTDKYYNFHSFPFNKWAQGPQPGMIGAEIGVFLSKIRRADFHIVTAKWVGLADRIEPPVAKVDAILASSDPVALDYHSAKYLVYPNSGIRFHDPDNPDSPTYQYIKSCSDHGGGVFDESKIRVQSWDFQKQRLQSDDDLVIMAKRYWGNHIRTLAKYAAMRWIPDLVE